MLLVFFPFGGDGGSFVRYLLTSKLNLSSGAIGARWTHILQMHLLFASWRINIIILDEQQLEDLHVVAFLMGPQDEIICISLTFLNEEEKAYYIIKCQKKSLKNLFFILNLLWVLDFQVVNELEICVCSRILCDLSILALFNSVSENNVW